MLVSASASHDSRQAVTDGRRPCPEYIALERDHNVEICDWSQLPIARARRSIHQSLVHVWKAQELIDKCDVVFTDGEHLGIPFGYLLAIRGSSLPHMTIGHHLTTSVKRRLWRLTGGKGISRILVHSQRQLEIAATTLGIPKSRLAFIPYCADTKFWSPSGTPIQRLAVSAGREQRDFATLATACADLDLEVVVASGSLHSPRARSTIPHHPPSNFHMGFKDHLELRDLYDKAAVVVVPLIENDFQAGVTTILEAMSMGKAVIASDTAGQQDVIEDGVTGLMVPPGDASALRNTVKSVISNPVRRDRLGRNAREAVLKRFSLDGYSTSLVRHLMELTASTPVALPDRKS